VDPPAGNRARRLVAVDFEINESIIASRSTETNSNVRYVPAEGFDDGDNVAASRATPTIIEPEEKQAQNG
jgi:hypothetical protein